MTLADQSDTPKLPLVPLERDVLALLRSRDDWWRVRELKAALVGREPYCAVPPSDERIVAALGLLTRLGLTAKSGAPWPAAAWTATR